MRLIYGTTNAAKLSVMREATAGLALDIAGLCDLGYLPDVPVDESGRDPLENAAIKARAYFGALHEPVFSCDSGLYLDGLPRHAQPGVHVRRVAGRTLNDEEMIAYYGGLARRYGMLRARYQNAVCVVLEEGREIKSMGIELSSKWFGIVAVPHPGYLQGFPLDALSVRLKDKTPYLELEGEFKRDVCAAKGFRRFFEKMLASL